MWLVPGRAVLRCDGDRVGTPTQTRPGGLDVFPGGRDVSAEFYRVTGRGGTELKEGYSCEQKASGEKTT